MQWLKFTLRSGDPVLTEPHCVHKRETGVTLGDVATEGWIGTLQYIADVVLRNTEKTLDIAL